MSDPVKTYVGEIGKRIKVDVGISLANLSAATLQVEKPDGAAASTWTASVLGADENGFIYHDVISGDLNIRGLYRIWAKLVYTDGKTLYGAPTYFNVYAQGEGE